MYPKVYHGHHLASASTTEHCRLQGKFASQGSSHAEGMWAQVSEPGPGVCASDGVPHQQALQQERAADAHANCEAVLIPDAIRSWLKVVQAPAQIYLNLVLEFVPVTVFRISKHYSKSGQRTPMLIVKLCLFQMPYAVG